MRKKGNFKGKVSKSMKNSNSKNQFGYLNLNDDVEVFDESKLEGEHEEGKTVLVTLDILPYTVTDDMHPDRDDRDGIALNGELWYRRPFTVHWGIGADNKTYPCPKDRNKSCPIDNYITKGLNSGDLVYDDIKNYRRKDRLLYAVRIHNQKNFDPNKVYIWNISYHLFQKQLKQEIEESEITGENYEVFPDPDYGYALKIRLLNKKWGEAEFKEATRIDFIKREKPIPDDILNKVPNLDEIINYPSTNELAKVFLEGVDEEETKDEEEMGRKRKEIKNDKCLYGYKFGKDTDQHPECDMCKVWEQCVDKKESDDIPF